MTTEAAEFNEKEFLEVATRHSRQIGQSGDPQAILSRYARGYTEDPEGTVSTVIWLLREQNREYSRGAIEEFLRTNAETRAASLAAKVAPASFASEAQSGELTGESKRPSKSSFPPGWSAGKIINYLRNRDEFRELERCRELLQDPVFLRSVKMVPPQRVSAHLLARLLNLSPAKIDGIEKGTIPGSPEVCDSLIVIFGFHEQAADEFRSRAGLPGTERPADITAEEREAALAQERSVAAERRRVIRDAEEQLRERAASDATTRLNSGDCGSLAEFLRLLRHEQGLSGEQTANKLGVSRSAIKHYESGTIPNDLDEIERGYTRLSPSRKGPIHAQFALAKRQQAEARQQGSERQREIMLARRAKSPDEMAAARARQDSGDYSSFGEFLRLLREEQGLSTPALAARLGINQSQISRYELGNVFPSDPGTLEEGYIRLFPNRKEVIHAQFALARRRQKEARGRKSERWRESMLARDRKSPDEMAAAGAQLDSGDYSSFGEFLALLHDEEGLSLNAVAARVGSTALKLSSYKRGIFPSDPDTLEEGYVRVFPHRAELIRTEFATAKRKKEEARQQMIETSRQRTIEFTRKSPEDMATARARLDSGDYSSLGELLTLLRGELGLSTRTAAQISGIDVSSILPYERGRLPNDFDRLEEGYIRLSPHRGEAIRTQVATAKRAKGERDRGRGPGKI